MEQEIISNCGGSFVFGGETYALVVLNFLRMRLKKKEEVAGQQNTEKCLYCVGKDLLRLLHVCSKKPLWH